MFLLLRIFKKVGCPCNQLVPLQVLRVWMVRASFRNYTCSLIYLSLTFLFFFSKRQYRPLEIFKIYLILEKKGFNFYIFLVGSVNPTRPNRYEGPLSTFYCMYCSNELHLKDKQKMITLVFHLKMNKQKK